MTDLTARAPAADLLPATHGRCSLSEEWPDAITALTAWDGSAALPGPGESVATETGLTLWSGRRQALHIGPPPPPQPGAAQADQTDGWCVMVLSGEDAAEVLARLTPLDLNPAIFKPGRSARSLLGHMNALFHRIDERSFRILVFRSMAGSAVHELTRAMRGVAARRG
ncbi:sarcosine oxidase subunit gamma [Jannaschia ovalis]|uniref:Sarcosine oxidase subunit gamma n=1 Tax=Jannaschia ovalis TaxID=3038773 RepID=A0ABY8LF67_9RHOB|nr:sarcosine oxidase subunit gamma [Jannaschia sp. GRR-S6-38]WGH79292.1 sarcosine oxidase subunit gamma [Jannaschia sp. GRR-S6-38]